MLLVHCYALIEGHGEAEKQTGGAGTKPRSRRLVADDRHLRRLLPLACLSPRIVEAIADGTAPANLTLSALTAALPYSWAEQEHRFLIR